MIETRAFGKTGLQVSALGIGAAEIGFERATHETVENILSAALDAGINVIDTAAMYLDSEEKMGRSLQGKRKSFLLFTKCGAHLPPKSTFAGFVARLERKWRNSSGGKDKPGHPQWHAPFYWHPRVLQRNIEQSLIRLKTDYIDLIQLHTCSEETLRAGDAIEALQRARQAGKVRYIGYSGDGQAAAYAIQCGQFDALQTSVNIADQQAIDLIVPPAVKNGMGVIAKRPIANGVWKYIQRPEDSNQTAYWERLQKLQYDWVHDSEAFETALRFTLAVPGVSTVIVGTKNLAHFRQNLGFAAAGVLERPRFEAIRSHWNQIAQSDWVGQT